MSSFQIASGGLSIPERIAGFDGIRVIADVHGDFDKFDHAIKEAERANRFVVQLGDLIDRGPCSTFCVERMLALEDAGKGIFVLGNHEVAFERFARTGEGGAAPRQAVMMEFEEHGDGLLDRFLTRVRRGPLWVRHGHDLFVHATFVPAMLEDARIPVDAIVDAAIHGEGSSVTRRQLVRSRKWVDRVPRGLAVYVGHHVTDSRRVERVVGRLGGKAVFADTGAWLPDGKAIEPVDLPFLSIGEDPSGGRY